MQRPIVVLDLGGTNLRLAFFNRGELVELREYPSIAPMSPEEGIKKLKEWIRGFEGEIGTLVLGFPGLIARDGTLRHSPNLKAYEGVNLKESFSDIGVPVFVENDANLYALGEGYKGAAQGKRNFCCLTLGTGVGSGVVVEGKLLKGHKGVASEIGHMSVEAFGVPCTCGSRGCLEAYCSGRAILRMARDKGLEAKDAEEVAELARMGYAAAKEVFATMGTYLGIGLSNIANIFNPELIVIGGKVSRSYDLFVPHALEVLRERAFGFVTEDLTLAPSPLGDLAALWGGVALVEGIFT